MKSLKKILSIFAAFMMVIGLTAANVKAEGEISITVTNPEKDKVYTAYRLLQANIGEGNAVAYFVDENGKTALEQSGLAPEYFTISKKKNPDNTYNVSLASAQQNQEATAKAIAAKFRAYLEGLKENDTNAFVSASATATTDQSVTISNLPGPGYYFVTTGNGSLVRVDTLGNNATVENKKDQPEIEKTVNNNNNNTVNVGDEVEFTLTAKLKPGFAQYSITDTMTGLTFKEITSVTKDEVEVNENDYPFTVNENPTSSLVLTFKKNVVDALTVDTSYVIKYKATVNQDAEIGKDKITNEAILKFGNNDNEDKSEVKLSTYQFGLTKTKDNQHTQLDGAEFELSLNGQKINFVKSGNEYTVTSAAIGASNTTTTIEAGAVTIKGLANGEYTLTEIKAPAGYNKLEDVLTIKIYNGNGHAALKQGSDSEYQYSETTYVLNTQGTQLPSTGGMGTTMIYIAGAILMVGAAIIFVTNKRMKHE